MQKLAVALQQLATIVTLAVGLCLVASHSDAAQLQKKPNPWKVGPGTPEVVIIHGGAEGAVIIENTSANPVTVEYTDTNGNVQTPVLNGGNSFRITKKANTSVKIKATPNGNSHFASAGTWVRP